ncbi:MAG: hypothetical protein M1829_000115 [Trizodia sp. TS-e1964]|nr:MAG: hypothetical protein M1829_000115 [Trizodia sp. TS-e1964]
MATPIPAAPPAEVADLNINNGRVFIGDSCLVRGDTLRFGVITRTWHEADEDSSAYDIDDLTFHPSSSAEIYDNFLMRNILPQNYAVISFSIRAFGTAIVPENALIILDRSVNFGDTVKRNSSDTMTGIITRTQIHCNLRPSLPTMHDPVPSESPEEGSSESQPKAKSDPLLKYYTTPPSNYLQEASPAEIEAQMINDVPGAELTLTHDYELDDFIFYKGWVGQVEALAFQVTLRLCNGSVVVVENPNELEIPRWEDQTEIIDTKKSALSLPDDGDTSPTQDLFERKPAQPLVASPDGVTVGMFVCTKKGNLRRGIWKYGAYDPSIPPQGYVVENRTTSMHVNWLCSSYSQSGQPLPHPPDDLNSDILNGGAVSKYQKGRKPKRKQGTPLPHGSFLGTDLQSGDRVVFKDFAAATTKYNGTGQTRDGRPQGKVTKIPREHSQGYDMNSFVVVNTETTVTVLWQDLTSTTQKSVRLVPHLNVDEQDYWPGQVVLAHQPPESRLKTYEGMEVFKPKQVGVIQSVNSAERIADIRWFQNPRAAFIGVHQMTIAPGCDFGKLFKQIESVSCYDLMTYPSFDFERGDFVLVAHYWMNGMPPNSKINIDNLDLMADLLPRGFVNITNGIPRAFNHTLNYKPGEFGYDLKNWCGEIVDLGIDGIPVVRFGGREVVRDAKISWEHLIMLKRRDDRLAHQALEALAHDDDDDVVSWDSDWESEEDAEEEGSEDEVLAEDLELDQFRPDNPIQPYLTSSLSGVSTSDDDFEPAKPNPASATAEVREDGPLPADPEANPEAKIETKEEAPLVALPAPKGPPLFDILDKLAPENHHFFKSRGKLSASGLKRIIKEHQILESALPEGIYVRTWASRLDLMRVLIIGAKNTPYQQAPFIFDFHFGADFPHAPPAAYFHSWTRGIGRINPNLYENGKICLSLLGTWPGDAKVEKWASNRSSVLQILVSLMGLVLVREPFFNEAGFEQYVGSEDVKNNSALYTERAYVLARGFINHAVHNHIGGLEDILTWLYFPSKDGPGILTEVIKQSKELIAKSESKPAGARLGTFGDADFTLSAGALILLKRTLAELEGNAAKRRIW